MKKFTISGEWDFERTVARLHRLHEVRKETLADSQISEEDRAYRVLSDNRFILDLRRALREYLVARAVEDDAAFEHSWDEPPSPMEIPQPELARAA